MEKNLRLQELFELAKKSQLVKTKGDFANLIGIKDQGTLSHALSGDKRYSIDNLIDKAELALYRKGVLTNGVHQQDGEVISLLREQIDYLKQNNTDLRGEVETLKNTNKELQNHLSDALYSLRIEQQKASKKRVRTNTDIPISQEIESEILPPWWNMNEQQFLDYIADGKEDAFMLSFEILLGKICIEKDQFAQEYGIRDSELHPIIDGKVNKLLLDSIHEEYAKKNNLPYEKPSEWDLELRRQRKVRIAVENANKLD